MKIWSLESFNPLKKKPLFPVQVVRLDAGQAVAEGRVRYLFAEGRVRLHSCSKESRRRREPERSSESCRRRARALLFAEGRVRCLCTQSSESKGRRRSLLPFDTEV